MSRLQSVWEMLGRIKYLLIIIVMAVIIGILDDNSYYSRWQRRQRMSAYEEQITKLREQYETDSTYLHDLETNPAIVERLARERYFMHRDGEDVFIINEEPVATESEAIVQEGTTAPEEAQPNTEAAPEDTEAKNDSTATA